MSGWIWLGLVLGGIALTIAALAGIGPQTGLAVGLASVGGWIACGIWQAWYFGVNRHLLRHLGSRGQTWKKSSVVTHVIATSERADLQMALDHLHSLDPNRPEIFGMGDIHSLIAVLSANPYPVPVEAEAFPRSAKETVDCATNALYRLRCDGQAFLAFVRPRGRYRYRSSSRQQMELEVLAANRDVARQALAHVLNLANQRSVYRGQVLALGKAEDRREEFSLRFHDLPRIERDDIVLPEAVMASSNATSSAGKRMLNY